MRIFKNKWFKKWAHKEEISDATLWNAAVEICLGNVEADLGGCLFKKRVARPGTGKRDGYRTIVGYKKPNSDRIIFLYAYAKNRKANMSTTEEAALSIAAKTFILASDAQINELMKNGSIVEVHFNV